MPAPLEAAGVSAPLGATVHSGGVNFSLFSRDATSVDLLLFDDHERGPARVITLDKNYRSTPAILRAASALIDHNRQRKKKTLKTDNEEGEPVRVLTFDTGLDEAEIIACGDWARHLAGE